MPPYLICSNIYEEKGESPLDPETGCDRCADDYEQCRQSYYAKKQLEVSKQSTSQQTQCDYSEYQNQINNLMATNTLLTTENAHLKSQYKNLTESLSYNQECRQNTAYMFLDNVISYQGLIVLMSIVIIGLGYFLYKIKLVKNK